MVRICVLTYRKLNSIGWRNVVSLPCDAWPAYPNCQANWWAANFARREFLDRKETQIKKGGQGNEHRAYWTPYRIADGERIEGTFVRQMEAGLRSQSMVLHKDGSFAGDGLNVTMGGREVSPAFPERGYGTCEVRTGSMILYFANGFTRAIACTIDATNTGEAETVLLNGFPFQRVR